MVEKIVVEELSRFYKINLKLHKSQIWVRKTRTAIRIVAIMFDNIDKLKKEKKITALLLMDIKRAFDYVFWVKLV